MSSWGTWVELAAMAEYANRHPRQAGEPGPYGGGAADEAGLATRMTWTSAGNRMQLGQDFTTRLPRTFAALRAGLIDMVHATVIHDATKDLSVTDALTADAGLAAAAQLLTPGLMRGLLDELTEAYSRLRDGIDPGGGHHRGELPPLPVRPWQPASTRAARSRTQPAPAAPPATAATAARPHPVTPGIPQAPARPVTMISQNPPLWWSFPRMRPPLARTCS
jgi:Domain of unknown function (DUF222)